MSRRLVDLTQEIYNGMPVYPGHQRTAIFPVKTHEETKELNKPGTHHSTTMAIIISDHGPTHVDSYLHMEEEGEDIDQIPLELFYTPAVCLDVSHRVAGEYITADDIDPDYVTHDHAGQADGQNQKKRKIISRQRDVTDRRQDHPAHKKKGHSGEKNQVADVQRWCPHLQETVAEFQRLHENRDRIGKEPHMPQDDDQERVVKH